VGKLLGFTWTEVSLGSVVQSVGFALASLGGFVWLFHLAGLLKKSERKRLAVEAGEGGLLLAVACFLHPVFAVGLYFLAWHALRHTARLIDRECPVPTRDRFGAALAWLHLKALPLLIPGWLLLGAIMLFHGDLASPEDWVGALLISFVVFTPAHHLLVEGELRRPGSAEVPTK